MLKSCLHEFHINAAKYFLYRNKTWLEISSHHSEQHVEMIDVTWIHKYIWIVLAGNICRSAAHETCWYDFSNMRYKHQYSACMHNCTTDWNVSLKMATHFKLGCAFKSGAQSEQAQRIKKVSTERKVPTCVHTNSSLVWENTKKSQSDVLMQKARDCRAAGYNWPLAIGWVDGQSPSSRWEEKWTRPGLWKWREDCARTKTQLIWKAISANI